MYTDFNKTNNADRLQKFISETKRNGYFAAFNNLSGTKNRNSDLDTFYRKKAEHHYAQKIKRPFRLADQP